MASLITAHASISPMTLVKLLESESIIDLVPRVVVLIGKITPLAFDMLVNKNIRLGSTFKVCFRLLKLLEKVCFLPSPKLPCRL